MFTQVVVLMSLVVSNEVQGADIAATCSATSECITGNGGSYATCTGGSNNQCECPSGYTQTTGTNVCTPDTGSTCVSTNTEACTDSHATCGGTSGSEICACDAGYYAVGTTCTIILGTTCTTGTAGSTECATTRGLTNSECSSDGRCLCMSGYCASTDLTACNQESGTNGIMASSWLLIITVAVVLNRMLR